MLCSLLVLFVLVVLVRSGLPVLPVLVPVPVLFVLFVLAVLAVLVLAVLAVLVLVDWPLLAEAVCAPKGVVPTRASSSSVASIIATRGAARPAGEEFDGCNKLALYSVRSISSCPTFPLCEQGELASHQTDCCRYSAV